MLELAFDFARDQVSRKFVREQVLFGKSRPVALKAGSDYCDLCRGNKRVQILSQTNLKYFELNWRCGPDSCGTTRLRIHTTSGSSSRFCPSVTFISRD